MTAPRKPWFEALREWGAIVPYSVPEHVRVPPETWQAVLDIVEAADALVRAEDADHEALRLMETDEDVTLSRERQRTARKVADLAFANLVAALAAANSQSVPRP